MSSEIDIPDGFINDFISENSVSENSVSDTTETELAGSPANSETVQKIVRQTLDFAFSAFDEMAKDRDLSGLGNVKPADASELTYIVLDKNFSEKLLNYSPEAALFSLFSGIAINNYISFQKQKKGKTNE